MNAKAMGGREHEQQRQSSAAGSMISNDKNLMPSMVVRQQKNQLLAAETASSSDHSASNNNLNHQPNLAEEQLESASTLELLSWTRRAAASDQSNCSARSHNFDQNGLILPRRVPHQHPQLLVPGDSGARQQANTIRDLNRELKFNQVCGKNVLDQKSELKRAMEKLAASRRKKEAEQERLARRSSFELRLQERAERVAHFETTDRKSSSSRQGELVRATPE